jgi:phenol 2-monooxygenase
MLGDTTDSVWGVMDIYPITTFPDIRRKCTIHSTSGNLVIIPREGGSLVRFYIQLPAGTSPKNVKLTDLQETTRRIFAPHAMDFADVFWWSAYSIGQRLAEHFHTDYRVFLTGDACHTHSPKAGQGMNVSLQDGYNIGWKLGSVLSGLSPKEVLQTYVSERSQIAAELIAFDRELTGLFARKEEFEGEFKEYFVKSGRYMAGLGARYGISEVVDGEKSRASAAKEIVVGMRFPSAQVIRFCDCKAIQLLSALKSDGKWRVVVFAGDVNRLEHRERLEKVCSVFFVTRASCLRYQLASSLLTLSRRFTPSAADIDSIIGPILVLSSKFVETEQEMIPDYFWPASGKWKIRGESSISRRSIRND